jgi:hypothetical protein
VKEIKMNGAMVETPFTIQQVETHLIFGPLSRHFSTAYLMLFGFAVSLIVGLSSTEKPIGQYIGSIADKLIFLFVPLLLLKMSRRQQAIVGWIAVKFSLGIAAFLMILAGALPGFQRGDADAWPLLFLGLIWIPWIEFIPAVAPHQKYVTLARFVLSAPCIYFGIKSGNWHW